MQETTAIGLAARLRTETRDLHTQAERSGVMADLLHGRLTQVRYCALLRNLHAIYGALEPALDRHVDDPRLWRPELRRVHALEVDLDRLHTHDWRLDNPLTPAAVTYVARLRNLADQAPTLLVAHAYLRYLGDLHGGQILSRLVQRQFNLDLPEGSPGTAFYAFGDPAQVQTLARDFRTGLDALAPSLADDMVAEACAAFRLHRQLFEQLQEA